MGQRGGYTAGTKDGKKTGYKSGFASGKSTGYWNGYTEGCLDVFDELGSERVYDNFGYYFLTRGDC